METNLPAVPTPKKKRGTIITSPCVVAMDVSMAFASTSDIDHMDLLNAVIGKWASVKGGSLEPMEEMLVGQAIALQTIFSNLAVRAANQTELTKYQAFFSMAMKAQAQSRATIAALVDLKYPRQVTFVKQTNTAHGPQQVNNGTAPGESSHTKELPIQHNELLEDARNGGTHMDAGATAAAARGNPEMEAMAAIDRPKEPRRQAGGLPQRALDRTSSDSRYAEKTE